MRKSYIIAFIILIAASLWMLPAFMADKEQAVIVKKTETTRMRVEVLLIKPSAVQKNVIVNGQTKASRIVELRARTDGKIAKVLLNRGANLNENQLIAKMDIDDRQARLNKALAVLQQRKTEYAVAKGLKAKGFNSQVKLETAKANQQIAKSDVKQAELDISYTKITAPFTGVLEDRHIEQGDYVRMGDVMATVIDLDPLDISTFVSERYINSIKLGSVAEVTLHDGAIITGNVYYIAKLANERTRTFRVDVRVDNPDYKISSGLTASVSFLLPKHKAYYIPLSAMVLNDKGIIGVKIVEDDKAKFMPIKIVKEEVKSVWVDGLTGDVELIIVGQQFIKDGQPVISVQKEASK